MVNTERIDDLLRKRESERLEFKTASADVRSIATAVCALLNGKGGSVVVGVGERGLVERLTRPNQRARKIETFLHEKVSPCSLWSVNVAAATEGKVIVIEVPAGSEKPYVCDGSIFVRRGRSTVAADADTIRTLVAQQHSEPTPWEKLPADGLDLEHLASDEILRTVDEAQRKRNYMFRQPGELAAVLSDLSLMQSGTLTNGADVLFACNPSGRLPQTRVRATVYSTGKGSDFVDDRLFEGNALSLLEQVFGFVQQHVRVESKFKPGKVTREDRPQYPFWALREGLVNAIIHRDYSVFTGGMTVGIYPNRIEIWNTGRLPQGWSLSDLKKDHPSQPANPHMAHVFYLRGIIERVGRGTLKILDECKAAGLRAPQWNEVAGGITLVFHGERRRIRLNQRQRRLLQRLQPGDSIRPSDYYAEMEGVVTDRQSRRDLSGLEAGGWLRQQGEGKATVYIRTDQEAP
jgi:ATP-dependent DNA helicase RecG